MGRPQQAVFKYHHDTMAGDFYKLTYFPAHSLLFITAQINILILDAHIILNVKELDNELGVEQVVCYKHDHQYIRRPSRLMPFVSINSNTYDEFCWRGTHVVVLKYLVQERVLELVKAMFFGKEWKWCNLERLNDVGIIPSEKRKEGQEVRNSIYNNDVAFNKHVCLPIKRVLVWMDNTAELNAAAAKIQAVYKGWQARMAYRFNPLVPLGKHIALKIAGFIDTPVSNTNMFRM
jgi:hypothetical protein